MSKHTKGPWQVAKDGSIGSIETVNGNKPIGHSFQTQPTRRPEDHEERIANAYVMAAGPDLLEALKEAYQHINGGSGIKQGMEWKAMYDKIGAAIAKAEGEST